MTKSALAAAIQASAIPNTILVVICLMPCSALKDTLSLLYKEHLGGSEQAKKQSLPDPAKSAVIALSRLIR
jgi:hypothetical protein